MPWVAIDFSKDGVSHRSYQQFFRNWGGVHIAPHNSENWVSRKISGFFLDILGSKIPWVWCRFAQKNTIKTKARALPADEGTWWQCHHPNQCGDPTAGSLRILNVDIGRKMLELAFRFGSHAQGRYTFWSVTLILLETNYFFSSSPVGFSLGNDLPW